MFCIFNGYGLGRVDWLVCYRDFVFPIFGFPVCLRGGCSGFCLGGGLLVFGILQICFRGRCFDVWFKTSLIWFAGVEVLLVY